MKTQIITKIKVEGIHFWENAKEVFPDVAFLSYPHRHIFHITLKKYVSHLDRDIEIIRFGRQVIQYLKDNYGIQPDKTSSYELCNFGGMSCEMIATELVNVFELSSCIVLEDDENGSEVTA